MSSSPAIQSPNADLLRPPAGAQTIIHVPRRFTAEEWGGTETVLAELLTRQRAAGALPEIHTSLALSRRRREQVRGLPVFRHGYCLPYLGLSAVDRDRLDRKGGNLVSAGLFWTLLRKPGVRLFHAHAIKRLGAEVATVARWRRIPFVVTLHGGVFDVPAPERAHLEAARGRSLEWGRALGVLLGSRRLLQNADAVICVGRGEYEKARARLGHERVFHIGNGVEPRHFQGGDRSGFRSRWALPPEARVITCISRLDPQKDQMLLVSAFDALAESDATVHLVLAGPSTDPEYTAALDARIAGSAHRGRIRRLGALDSAGREVADALAGADVFALASRHEPFGIVALEAWCAGLPVVASRAGGLGQLVQDGVNGWSFATGDVAGAVAALRGVLAAPDGGRSLGQRGATDAARSHSWDQVAAETERVYRFAEERVARRTQR